MSCKELDGEIYTRLSGDATMAALSGLGFWNGHPPSIAGGDVRAMTVWRVFSGGDTNDAPGRFKDVTVHVDHHVYVQEGVEHALDMEARAEELLKDWRPTMASWPIVFDTTKVRSLQNVRVERGFLSQYRFGAFYRFRFGTDTAPSPPALPAFTGTAAAGYKTFIEVIHNRLAKDDTLITTAQGGVWTGNIPRYDNILEYEVNDDGNYVPTGNQIDFPTWVELYLTRGGPTNDETGPDFRDLLLTVRSRTFSNTAQAITVDDRVDTLLHGWVPTFSGWSSAFAINRILDQRRGGRIPGEVDLPYWEARGVYRIRVEK